jgi:hypothetical protein
VVISTARPAVGTTNCMQQRTVHHLLACLLAPIVLVTNAAPVAVATCANSTTAAAVKKCCGCCQAKAKQVRSCCKARAAAETLAVAKPKCCCTKGTTQPVAPATIPSDSEELVKLNLASMAAAQPCPAPLVSLSQVAISAPTALDYLALPVRVRFSIWLI